MPAIALEVFHLQPENFDLVITDMTMPHMTGAELSQEILNIRPDIPIIMCSGREQHKRSNQELRLNFFNSGGGYSRHSSDG